MNNYIVTTTINLPTKATLLYCEKKDWNFIIVGDSKTPHEAYQALEKKYSHVVYLSPEMQEKRYKALSDSIGWKTVERRNIGYLYAYQEGADIVATVDDDNVPLPHWGKNILVGNTIDVECYEPENGIFDPLSVTKANYLWHRGYPVQLLQTRNTITKVANENRKVLVQADLWNGDPDIDAIARITFCPLVDYNEITKPYCSNKISPFNSQNTFLAREVLPFYALFPYIGRMEDIWGAYVLQYYFPNSVIYNSPSVVQERNEHDLVKDLEDEVIGYRHSLSLLLDLKNYENYLPEPTKVFYELYRKSYTS